MSSTPPIRLRLQQIRLEAEGIASYEFVPAGDAPLPAFTAGAHIDLHLPQDMVRSYSLVNAPSDQGRYVIAVQRDSEGRGGSAWMHSAPRVGDLFRATPPGNDFALAEDAAQSVFIAGGIGITPVLSMLHRLDALGRRWRLHYASRSPQEAAYVAALRAMDGVNGGRGEVDLCFGSSRIDRLDIAGIVRDAPPEAHLYCCGPARMIDAFIAACASRAPHTVHFERFAASSEAATEGGYEVVLNRSGERLTVAPGKTILDTLLDHAIDVPYACTAGVCGTCRTPVISGDPDHRDDFLSAQEKQSNDTIMICCSGSRSKTLVLDL